MCRYMGCIYNVGFLINKKSKAMKEERERKVVSYHIYRQHHENTRTQT